MVEEEYRRQESGVRMPKPGDREQHENAKIPMPNVKSNPKVNINHEKHEKRKVVLSFLRILLHFFVLSSFRVFVVNSLSLLNADRPSTLLRTGGR
jgi:hypothetical protein